MMKQRTRIAGLAFDTLGRILLVREVDFNSGQEFWVAPGGALEAGDISLASCLQREFQEETGLQVEVGKVCLVRELLETQKDTRHLEIYFLIRSFSGTVRETNAQTHFRADDLMRHARWFAHHELAERVVYPADLKSGDWQNLTSVAYLLERMD